METLEDSARQQVERNKRERQHARLAARAEQSSHQGSQRPPQSDGVVQLRNESEISTAGSSNIPSLQFRNQMNSSANVPRTEISYSPLQLATYPSMKSSKQGEPPHLGPGAGPALPTGQSALTPIASRVREQDADAIAQFMDAFKRKGTGSRSEVVDPGRPWSPNSVSSTRSGFTGARAAIHRLKQSVSSSQYKEDLMPTLTSSTDEPIILEDDARDTDSGEFAQTPRAAMNQSPLTSRESITPPAHRRSPFALLSRTLSQQDT
jgi:hypothetical protein